MNVIELGPGIQIEFFKKILHVSMCVVQCIFCLYSTILCCMKLTAGYWFLILHTYTPILPGACYLIIL